MKLKRLLDSQNWDDAEFDYKSANIESMIRSNVENHIRELFRHYYASIALNGFFLILTIITYFILPSWDILLPLFLIASPFLLMLTQIVSQLLHREKTDPTSNLKTLLEQTLSFNQKINRSIYDLSGMIFTSSFLGGFFLGLIVQGWTLQELIGKPLVLLIMLILAIGVYVMVRTKRFFVLAGQLNPGYQKTKKYLEEQLKELQGEGAE